MELNYILLLAFIISTFKLTVSIEQQFVSNESNTLKTDPLLRRKTFVCPTKCHCITTIRKVTCSGIGLTTLPHNLPNTTRVLVLTNNNFTKVRDGIFKDLPLLMSLDMTNSSIRDIGGHAFDDVPDLQSLNLSYNPLDNQQIIDHVFCGLSKTDIRVLILRGVSMGRLNRTSLKCLQNLPITHLNFSSNHDIGDLQNGEFSGISTLQALELKGNTLRILNPMAFIGLRYFNHLSLGFNQILNLPKFMNGNKSILPHLKELFLNYNLIGTFGNFKGLYYLEFLNLQHNYIKSFERWHFKHLPSLKVLNLAQNILTQIEPGVYAFGNLEFISLSSNRLNFKYSNTEMFRKAKQLKKIIFSENKFAHIEFVEKAFQNLPSLQYLNLDNIGGIFKIPEQAFKNLHNLTVLGLNTNSLISLQMKSFEDLTSLKKLYLRGNSIVNVNMTSFPPWLLTSLEALDLSHNPYLCDCNLLWYTDWLKANHKKVVDFKSKSAYTCNVPQRKQLVKFGLTAKKCLDRDLGFGLRFSLALSSLLVVFVALASGLYRWRWKLQYQMFHISSWWVVTRALKANPVEPLPDDYLFDVFVGYNCDDSGWVNDILLVELEKKSAPPFKLCLYERDWLPGENIINCIGESIEKSRRVLLVVTNAFAQSQWCQLELTMAQHQLFEGDKDNLILAIMEDLEPLNMTPRLALEMKRRTYLTWTDNEDGQTLFWDMLTKALRQPPKSVHSALPPLEEFCD